MKKIRTLLVILSLLYTLITILLLVYEDALYNNLNLLDMMEYSKMWMVLGLVLLLGLIVFGSLYIRSLQNQYKLLDGEHRAVKARLYDIEASRKAEDEEAGRRINAFRQSLDKGTRPGETPPSQL